jgi:hypothetical protein
MQRWITNAALAATVAMLGLAGASWGQDDEMVNACEEACYEAEEQCFQNCENADDSDACAAICTEQAEECLQQCD